MKVGLVSPGPFQCHTFPCLVSMLVQGVHLQSTCLPKYPSLCWVKRHRVQCLFCSSTSTSPLLLRFTCHPRACSHRTASMAIVDLDPLNAHAFAVISRDAAYHAVCYWYTSMPKAKPLQQTRLQEPMIANSTASSLVTGMVFSAHVHPFHQDISIHSSAGGRG